MRHIIYFFFLFIFAEAKAQTPEKIKFQKNSNVIYFFSKTAKSDSIKKNVSDLFYLVIPDSLKKVIGIFIENGQILKTSNDSIIKIYYLPGLKYESQYVVNELKPSKEAKALVKKFDFISLINGPSVYPKNKILIQITNKKEEKVILENIFFYSN